MHLRLFLFFSFCSGVEAPIEALNNLGIPFEHRFSCDNDLLVRTSIKANHKPKQLFEDIKARDNAHTPYVDLYVAGFPCQPFSTAGKKESLEDSQGRGTIFFDVLKYIQDKRPATFILESVSGLTTLNEGKQLSVIVKALEAIKDKCTNTTLEKPSAYEIHHPNRKEHI